MICFNIRRANLLPEMEKHETEKERAIPDERVRDSRCQNEFELYTKLVLLNQQ